MCVAACALALFCLARSSSSVSVPTGKLRSASVQTHLAFENFHALLDAHKVLLVHLQLAFQSRRVIQNFSVFGGLLVELFVLGVHFLNLGVQGLVLCILLGNVDRKLVDGSFQLRRDCYVRSLISSVDDGLSSSAPDQSSMQVAFPCRP